MQRLKIDTKKINKSFLFVGDKGIYMDLTLMDNRDGTDQYGNDGFIVQDVGKQRREAGEKGPIIGNWKYIGQRPNMGITSPEYGKRETHQNGAAPPSYTADALDEDGEIPF